jgi:serine protease Do
MNGCGSEGRTVQRLLKTELAVTALGGTLCFVLCGVAFAGGLVVMPVGYAAMSAGSSAHASQGYLGVLVRDVNDEEIAALKLKEPHGALVVRVDHDAPAGKCGLHERDVILQMNGQAVEGKDQLLRMLRETPVGRTFTLTISRDGQQMSITTQTAIREMVERQAWEQHMTVPEPAASAAPAVNENRPPDVAPRGNGFFSSSTSKTHNFIGAITPGYTYTGATVETMGPQLADFFGAQGAGVLVHSVDIDSPAASAGLRAGDVILRANSVTMSTTSDWTKMMRENRGKKVSVVVLRDKKEQTLTLIPDSKKRSAVDSKSAPGSGNGATAGFTLR